MNNRQCADAAGNDNGSNHDQGRLRPLMTTLKAYNFSQGGQLLGLHQKYFVRLKMHQIHFRTPTWDLTLLSRFSDRLGSEMWKGFELMLRGAVNIIEAV